MRDYSKEFADRVQYIRNLVEESGVDGIVFGNSGGIRQRRYALKPVYLCLADIGKVNNAAFYTEMLGYLLCVLHVLLKIAL